MIDRGMWSSRLNFILASTGAAVGLGNIWKFPYMVGDNGGSAFVLLYLVFVAVIGIPILLAEMLLGKLGRQNTVSTLQILAAQTKASPHWQLVGWLGALTLVLVLSFYSVVACWALAYLPRAFLGTFQQASSEQILQTWQTFLASPWQILFWDALFMLMTMLIVARHLEAGLERASRIMMPALLIILLILLVYASTTSGFIPSIHYLFDFNLTKISGSIAISALGHAFFTLAIGVGCMLVYGSYLPPEARLGSTTIIVTALDVIVALLSGIAIYSVVFASKLSPQGGPGLMFEVLPLAFGKMPYGQIIGGLFFALLLFAAWTSSISMAEPLVILLKERYGYTRVRAATTVGIIAWILSIGSVLSFNRWQTIQIFHKWNFFAAITDLVTNILQPLGGLLFAIFVGWILPKAWAQKQLAFSHRFTFSLWFWLIRYIAPLGIAIILASSCFP